MSPPPRRSLSPALVVLWQINVRHLSILSYYLFHCLPHAYLPSSFPSSLVSIRLLFFYVAKIFHLPIFYYYYYFGVSSLFIPILFLEFYNIYENACNHLWFLRSTEHNSQVWGEVLPQIPRSERDPRVHQHPELDHHRVHAGHWVRVPGELSLVTRQINIQVLISTHRHGIKK